MIWVVVAAGGALGSLARHLVGVLMTRVFAHTVPWATVVVNVVGCFAIGILAGAVARERLLLSQTGRAFVFVGVLGGFTTFSTFGLDTFTLGHGGAYWAAFGNAAGQVAGGLCAVWVGWQLAHHF